MLPSNAPFSPEQIGWLNGYLAARFLATGGAETSPPASESAAATGVPLTILWGSQTGNSEGLAKKAAKNLTAQGHQVTVTDMAEADGEQLAACENLLIITSTYGDGEPPDNAAELHELLQSEAAPKLAGVNYAVLGLGDSEYPDFNQCAKDLDQFLAKLGATRLCPCIESDVDYDEPFAQWQEAVTSALCPA
ncbi:flavodoxin domain-containing protein [Roseibacillus ishigakijimensis]|uniref:Flavodoxin domain-containing protein n=1 Tax=Roseibacillus ishigakijimensis TaxID=454146 RepID=A0A934VLW7_9BACT|nr:flavodoxin domain-containing protein [Roseibacillus ishigakijimensis]MBK1833330.1 flavodoxin domain-containing protein [Roseibacillus ishigakijimensis]